MDSSQVIRLQPDLIARCERLGQLRVDRYAAGYNRGSRALSSHGAERDVDLQAKSMMAECAFCIWAGGDTEKLNWSGYSDGGFDAKLLNRIVDVKYTRLACHYLIWPVNKRPIFEKEPFDTLVLVKESLPDFTIAGWMSKEEFWKEHQEEGADRRHGLTPGTWFVHEKLMHPMWIIARPKPKPLPSWAPFQRKDNPWADTGEIV